MGTVASKREFASFKEFYPYYLQEHKNKVCRRLHFIGSWFVLAILFAAIYQQQYSWIILCRWWAMALLGLVISSLRKIVQQRLRTLFIALLVIG